MFLLETSSVATASANTPSYLKSDSFCYFCSDTTIDGNSFRKDHSGRVKKGKIIGTCINNNCGKSICSICAFLFSETMVDCNVETGQLVETVLEWYKVLKEDSCEVIFTAMCPACCKFISVSSNCYKLHGEKICHDLEVAIQDKIWPLTEGWIQDQCLKDPFF